MADEKQLRAHNRLMERWLGPVPWRKCSECGVTVYDGDPKEHVHGETPSE